MKQKFILFALLITAFWLAATPIDEPVGMIDDFRSPLVNPAAIGYGTASGITYSQQFDGHDFTGNYSLYANGNYIGYVFNHARGYDNHTLAISVPIVNNLYLGGSNNWTNSHFKDGQLHGSLLWRPVDYLSFGSVLMDTKDQTEYQLGLGLRPGFLPGDWAHHLTFGTDFYYLDEFKKPAFALDAEPIDGLVLGGRYSQETETFGLNFSLRMRNLGIGTVAHANDDNNKISRGYVYTTLADIPFRSITSVSKRPTLQQMELSGPIVERKKQFSLGRYITFTRNDLTMPGVIKDIQRMKDDPKITGIVIKDMNIKCSFAAKMEIKKAFDDFRSTGKRVIIFNKNFSNSDYMFAAAIADEIYLHQAGGVDLKGFSITVPYIGGLLDSLGIDVHNFRSHQYKTAMNMFSETDMTPSEREEYQYMLQDLFGEFMAMIEAGRGDKLTKPLKDIIDEGPYFIAEDALAAGLVDDIMHTDEFEDYIKETNNNHEPATKFAKETQRRNWSDPATEKLAIIYAVGNFHMGKGHAGVDVGEESIAKAIRDARNDKSIKAIVIRIDSGGGSSMASEIIAREVKLCRIGTPSKPVVVSMGGTAASAGYHMSAYAEKIFAEPTTITGSIGVVGAFPNFHRLMQKIRVHWATVKMGDNADFGSPYRELTEAEIAKVSHMIEESYQMFIGNVAEGRYMDKAAVHKVAQGRVWTGNQALKRGLVDEIGGLQDAIDAAAQMGGITHEVALVEFPKSSGTMNISFDADNKMLSRISPAALPASMEKWKNLYDLYNQTKDEQVLQVLPWPVTLD
ncbi:MAG: signal peptide peptidase SppA [Candidatus Cloacimonetes bacterium]|nr:signal peptide peptidase SppA [Candidatus Cloacimonadota bacterium]